MRAFGRTHQARRQCKPRGCDQCLLPLRRVTQHHRRRTTFTKSQRIGRRRMHVHVVSRVSAGCRGITRGIHSAPWPHLSSHRERPLISWASQPQVDAHSGRAAPPMDEQATPHAASCSPPRRCTPTRSPEPPSGRRASSTTTAQPPERPSSKTGRSCKVFSPAVAPTSEGIVPALPRASLAVEASHHRSLIAIKVRPSLANGRTFFTGAGHCWYIS